MKNLKKVCAVLVLMAILSTVLAGAAMAATYYYTTTRVNMRKGAGTGYSLITTLAKGTKVEKIDSRKASNDVTWYKVKAGSNTGWVCASYLTTSGGGSGTITMKGGKSYIRTGPGLGYKALTTIPQGATAKYTDTAYDNRTPAVLWYKIKYNGYTGWVSSLYTTNSGTSSGTKIVATKGSTNIRKAPDINSASIGTLSKGESAKYLNASAYDDRKPAVLWYKVSFNGKTGWVSSRYTTKK